MSTCSPLDLQKLGFQPMTMPQNLPDLWRGLLIVEGEKTHGIVGLLEHH